VHGLKLVNGFGFCGDGFEMLRVVGMFNWVGFS
jgi:hypothetical protein